MVASSPCGGPDEDAKASAWSPGLGAVPWVSITDVTFCGKDPSRKPPALNPGLESDLSSPALASWAQEGSSLGGSAAQHSPAKDRDDRFWLGVGFENGTHLSLRSRLKPLM